MSVIDNILFPWEWTGSAWNMAGGGSSSGNGYTGSQGTTGFTGSQGGIGFTGSQGVTGFTGSQGVVGFMGSKGDVGFTGSASTVAGPTGFTGSKGDTGTTGFTGSQGVIGFTGSKGDIGFTGSQGNIGFTGSQGNIGFTGSQGNIGFTGSQGNIGFTGSQGNKGGIRYFFDNTTTAGVSTDGSLRFNSGTIASVTQLYININDVNGTAFTNWINTFDDSTSTVKGYLTITNNLNGSAVQSVFSISSITNNTTYFTIAVSFISGSIPANNDALVVDFNRTGDLGATGFTGSRGDIGYTGSSGSGGGLVLTTFEANLGNLPRRSGSFNIPGSGLTTGKPVLIVQAVGPYSGKGTLADEAEMDQINVTASTSNNTNIKAYWTSSQNVRGNIKFNYIIGA